MCSKFWNRYSQFQNSREAFYRPEGTPDQLSVTLTFPVLLTTVVVKWYLYKQMALKAGQWLKTNWICLLLGQPQSVSLSRLRWNQTRSTVGGGGEPSLSSPDLCRASVKPKRHRWTKQIESISGSGEIFLGQAQNQVKRPQIQCVYIIPSSIIIILLPPGTYDVTLPTHNQSQSNINFPPWTVLTLTSRCNLLLTFRLPATYSRIMTL